MPRMIHPNVTDTIDVADEKAAVYQAQGWVLADEAAAEPEAGVAENAVKRPAAKKATKKAAKKA